MFAADAPIQSLHPFDQFSGEHYGRAWPIFRQPVGRVSKICRAFVTCWWKRPPTVYGSSGPKHGHSCRVKSDLCRLRMSPSRASCIPDRRRTQSLSHTARFYWNHYPLQSIFRRLSRADSITFHLINCVYHTRGTSIHPNSIDAGLKYYPPTCFDLPQAASDCAFGGIFCAKLELNIRITNRTKDRRWDRKIPC